MPEPLTGTTLRRLVGTLGMPLTCHVLWQTEAQVKDLIRSRQTLPPDVARRADMVLALQAAFDHHGMPRGSLTAWLAPWPAPRHSKMPPAELISLGRFSEAARQAIDYLEGVVKPGREVSHV